MSPYGKYFICICILGWMHDYTKDHYMRRIAILEHHQTSPLDRYFPPKADIMFTFLRYCAQTYKAVLWPPLVPLQGGVRAEAGGVSTHGLPTPLPATQRVLHQVSHALPRGFWMHMAHVNSGYCIRPEAMLIIPNFAIYMYSSSCNSLFLVSFSLIFFLYLFLGIPSCPRVSKVLQERDNYLNCSTQKFILC